jgi:hypothetical protein
MVVSRMSRQEISELMAGKESLVVDRVREFGNQNKAALDMYPEAVKEMATYYVLLDALRERGDISETGLMMARVRMVDSLYYLDESAKAALADLLGRSARG